MAFDIVVIVVITAFWALVGIVLPLFLPKGSNRGIGQTCLTLTAVCCYMMWLVTYMAQLNPLFGPQISGSAARLVHEQWGPAESPH